MDAETDKDEPEREWSEDDPAMRKPVRAQRKRHKMKVDGASVKNMLRIIGDRRATSAAEANDRRRGNPCGCPSLA